MPFQKGDRLGIATRLFDAGFKALVSVIPPNARLSSASRIRRNSLGKCPGLRRGDRWHGYDFLGTLPSREEIAEWDTWEGNLGLRTDEFPAIDIDINDEEPASLIEKHFIDLLGPAPCRLSQFDRRLLPYRSGEPISRHRLSFSYLGQRCAVEVLGKARQFVVHGTHPSGEQYRWRDKALWDLAPDSLTTLTAADIDAAFTALAEELRVTAGVTDVTLKVDGQRDLTSGGSAPSQEELQAPSLQRLSEVVATIPNDIRFEDRDDYIKVGYAIKAAGGEAAFPFFLDWCDRWEDGTNDPEVAASDWAGMSPPYRVGYGYLLNLSGLDDVDYEFEADLIVASDPTPQVDRPTTDFERSLLAAEALDCEWEEVPERIRDLQAMASELPPQELGVIQAAAVRALTMKRVRSGQEARQLLRLYAPIEKERAFELDESGVPHIRALTPADTLLKTPFLIDKHVPSAAVGVIFANYALGKSWLVIDMALAIAFGEPWLGHPTEESPVLFLIAEGNQDFPLRIFGWLVEHGLMDKRATKEELFEVLQGRVIINRYPARFDDPHFEVGLLNTVRTHGVGTVVVDTLGKSLGPDQSENDNDVANHVTGMLSRIAALTSCTTILTHHVGHGTSKRSRGASAWEQGLDFVFGIEGTKEEFGAGAPVRLVCHKMKSAGTPPAKSFRLKALRHIALLDSPSDHRLTTPSGVIEAAHGTGPALSMEARVFRYVSDSPGRGKGDVRAGVPGGNEGVDSALASLIQRGAVKNLGHVNGHRYHADPTWTIDSRGEVSCISEDFDLEVRDSKAS